jgi:hypothetical protein
MDGAPAVQPRVSEITMVVSHRDWRTIEASDEYYRKNWKTHKRWIAVVLTLYVSFVAIGIIATMVHRSNVSQSSRPEMAASLERAAR